MFDLQQMVWIRSTDDLPTVYNGQHGWIHKKRQYSNQDWYDVLTLDGLVHVFHESQLHKEHPDNPLANPVSRFE